MVQLTVTVGVLELELRLLYGPRMPPERTGACRRLPLVK